jgi:hypothetical protein
MENSQTKKPYPDTEPEYDQTPTPPRECGKPEPPKNPCEDPTAPTPPELCDKRPFEQKIKELESKSNQEDVNTQKAELAAYKKISDEVWKAEKDYAKDHDTLVRQEKASEAFVDELKGLLDSKLTAAEKKRIAEIVSCAPDLAKLKAAWLEARGTLPQLQATLSTAQNALADQEEIYKAALSKYQSAQKALDELQGQSTKEVDAKNYRGAWFLNQFEECPALEVPPLPCKFNEWLEAVAKDYVTKSEAVRKAKVTFEQAAADAQKKKKEYEDAKAKRRENILKAIASDPFPAPPSEDPGQYETGETDETAAV